MYDPNTLKNIDILFPFLEDIIFHFWQRLDISLNLEEDGISNCS